MAKEETAITREEFEAMAAELKKLQDQIASNAAVKQGGRCTVFVIKGKSRCIVPTGSSGAHVDGNPAHYNGNSHYSRDGQFVRG